jgi:GNAT superfamily N-acetyltransferase
MVLDRRGVAGSPYIKSFIVADEFRGHGVGSQMMAFAEDDGLRRIVGRHWRRGSRKSALPPRRNSELEGHPQAKLHPSWIVGRSVHHTKRCGAVDAHGRIGRLEVV